MNDELFTQTAPTNLLELTTLKSQSSKSNKRKTYNIDDDDDTPTSTTTTTSPINPQHYDKSLDLLEDSSVYLQRPQKKWRFTLQTSSAAPSLLFQPEEEEQQPVEPTEERFLKALETLNTAREQTEREIQHERECETVHMHEVQPLKTTTTTASQQKVVINEKCTEPDCLKTQVYTSSGLCRTHYSIRRARQRRSGIENNLRTIYSQDRRQELISLSTTETCLQTILMGTSCSASDCGGRLFCRNLCKRHYHAARRQLIKQKAASDNATHAQE